MRRILFAIVLVFIPYITAHAQTESRNRVLFEIPREFAFASCVFQPDSPVIIEEVQLLTDSEGSFPTVRYVVRNRSKKDIVFFAVDFHHRSKIQKWNSFADSWIETTGNSNSHTILLKPGKTYESMKKIQTQPVSFQKDVSELFDLSKSNAKLVTVWIGFVNRVVFKDGTEYNSPNYDAELLEIL